MCLKFNTNSYTNKIIRAFVAIINSIKFYRRILRLKNIRINRKLSTFAFTNKKATPII